MFVSLDPFRSVQVTMGLLWDQFRSIDKRQISKTTSAHSVEMSSCSRVGRGRSTESDTTSLLFRDGRLMRSRLLESCSSSTKAQCLLVHLLADVPHPRRSRAELLLWGICWHHQATRSEASRKWSTTPRLGDDSKGLPLVFLNQY